MRSWFSKSVPHQDSTDLPLYKRRTCFMREADRAMFDCLQQVAGQAYHIFTKVKLSALVEPQAESGNRVHQLHWIKVHRQTVDFLLCRRHDMEPMVALSLFPKMEYARRGLAAQDVTDVVLRDIGLPKLNFPERSRYDPEELKKKLKIALAECEGQSSSGRGKGRRSPNGASYTTAPN